MIESSMHHVDNEAGWKLGLRRVADPEHLNRSYRPVALVPGYGMNNHILGYHPAGKSLMAYLAEAGFEVWAISYRAMDGALPLGGSTDYDMKDISVTDLRVAVEEIASLTEANADRVDLVGCSLGGSIVFAHLALVPDNRVGSVVAVGAPLRWIGVSSLVKLAFSSEWLASKVRVNDTRRVARFILPALKYVPSLLSIYVHPDIVDMSKTDEMVKSVEDPNPMLNREIVRWLKNNDLVIDGTNVTEALRSMTNPLLVLTGNADGIVPLATARFPLDWVASERKDLIVVGDADRHFAHADLYVSRYSHDLVFAPLAGWLAGCYES